MSGRVTRLPEPLREAGTDLERRLLNAGAREQPSLGLSERMALGIGVSLPPPGASPASSGGSGAGTTLAAPKAAASSAVAPWVAGAVVAVGAAVALLVPRSTETSLPATRAPSTVPVASGPSASPLSAPATETPPAANEPSPRPSASAGPRRDRPAATAASDIREQIALVDSARAAIAAGNGDRALRIVREYQGTYRAGSFFPEVNALKIEALVELGRNSEARALAERFVADHRGSPLADRVARIAGLERSR